jgi:hypothetical protein
MFIFKATQLRGPAYPASTPYTDADGTQHASYPMELLQEIPDPQCPPDKLAEYTAHPDWYFVNDCDADPYTTWERKPQDTIDAQENAGRLAKIAALEEQQRREMARYDRESALEKVEALALSDFGLDPDQLYAVGKAPGAPIAAVNYVRLKDIDNAIKAEREGLV